LIEGGIGNEELYGGSGNDTLDGSSWADSLYGGNDNDVLIGGQSNDFLMGGAGADRFIYAAGHGHDIIRDFSTTQGDKIVFNRDAFDQGATLQDILDSITNVTVVDTSVTPNTSASGLRINPDVGGSISLYGVTSITIDQLEWMV